MSMRTFVFLAIFLMSDSALAEDLFHNCSDVLSDASYQALNTYLSEKNEFASYCQRLNNHEFVYTNESNFYYCNFKSNSSSACNEDSMGGWFPSLAVEARFIGENGKSFILFKTDRLLRGVHDTGYQVFHFTPKTEKPRGYEITNLQDTGEHNGLYSDAEEICSNLEESDQAIELIGYEVLNEGKRNVGIRFNQRVTFCKTKSAVTQMLEFTWSGKKFVRAKKRIH